MQNRKEGEGEEVEEVTWERKWNRKEGEEVEEVTWGSRKSRNGIGWEMGGTGNILRARGTGNISLLFDQQNNSKRGCVRGEEG